MTEPRLHFIDLEIFSCQWAVVYVIDANGGVAIPVPHFEIDCSLFVLTYDIRKGYFDLKI